MSALMQPTTARVGRDLKAALARCEERLEDAVGLGIENVAVPGATTLAAGGKRLRPLLVVACAGSGRNASEHVVRAAASVELVHMATLVHDDLLDGATIRRGHETIVSSHGPDAAIQVGDYLFARAFAELAATGYPESVGILAQAALDLSCGELAQGRAAYDLELSEEAYTDRVRRKTASLFAAACRIGALLGGASKDVQQRVADFGDAVGMAFQIFDDILDITGSSDATGKRRGADFRDGTITLPMIYAIQDEPALLDVIRAARNDDAIALACDRLNGHSGVQRARARALAYVADARAVLDGDLAGANRDALVLVADGVVDRYA